MKHTLLSDNIEQIISCSKLTGIILCSSTFGFEKPAYFSPESKCPNCDYNLYKHDEINYEWNPNGNSLIKNLMNIPIFSVQDLDASDTLRKVCFYLISRL
jgi:hypothetical protein